MIFSRRPAYPAAFATFGLLAATAGGCAWSGSSVDGSAGVPANPAASSVGALDQVTVLRAGYVKTMLSNSYTGPESESGIMSVVSGYGGGYVTDASLSGVPGPTEKLTLDVVLGGGSVTDRMQGETDFDPAAVACYRFTVGYYSYSVTEALATCPATLTTAAAQATAVRQIAEQIAAEHDDTADDPKSIPTTLAQAEQLVERGGPMDSSTTAALTAASFATGVDAVQHKPDAALALPQPGGGCVYVVYRWVQASWVGGGSSGTADSAGASAWAAPTDAACTGAAALSAGAFLTVDTYAGG